MTNRKSLVLTCFSLLTILSTQGQTIPNSTIDKAVENVVKGVPAAQLKNHKNNLIIVLPIRDFNGVSTAYSRRLANKIAHQLALRIKDYSVMSYDQLNDPNLVKLIDDTRLRGKDAQEAQLNKKIIENRSPDYMVTGDYVLDVADNQFTVENVTLFNNWGEGSPIVVLPFKDNAKVGLYRKYGLAFLPGGRQFHKGQKGKGAILLSGTLLFAAGAGISQALSANNYTQATQTKNIDLRRAYLEDSQSWDTGRNIFAIGAGALYLYNIIDAFASKGKKDFSSQSYYIKITPSQSEMGLAVTLKF